MCGGVGQSPDDHLGFDESLILLEKRVEKSDAKRLYGDDINDSNVPARMQVSEYAYGILTSSIVGRGDWLV
mgnify:CR=1 FL=1|jgi:hypothetical protein